MKKLLSLLCSILLIQIQVCASILPAGTSIVVQSNKIIDADDVKTGDKVSFTVLQSVKAEGNVVIKAGTEVHAKVLKRKNNFIFGIPGEIQVGDFQILVGNNIVRLRDTINDKGDSKYWANIGWIFVFPLLFIKGDDGRIPANSYILYTIDDVDL